MVPQENVRLVLENLVRLVEHFPGELLVVVLVTRMSSNSGEYSVLAAKPQRHAKTKAETVGGT